MDQVSRYKVIATPDEGYWCLKVPSIERATQARSIAEITPMAKDLIEIMTQDPRIEIDVDYDLPAEVAEAVELKRRAAELEQLAQGKQKAAAMALRDKGLTLRDIGKLLDISHQRAHQLIKAQ
ncbi:hypothetical protein [Paratractidigestivibacter sp.]|uniref:hypothetical protein n=2 Tax=Paratractidigestivibacter sp. TaxID=2847316 RepID=UPI002AC8D8FF|nr:hypothetical protein [Paratractidigestivibacter sp.]